MVFALNLLTVYKAHAQDFRRQTRKTTNTPDSLLAPEGPPEARTIHGRVSGLNDGEVLPLASIMEFGTSNGVLSELDGTFSIKMDVSKPCKLVCKYIGYQTTEAELNPNSGYIHFRMPESFLVKKELVVSASRKIERKFESPVSIEMLNITDIRNNPGINMYDAINNLSGIDVITTSVTFKTFNTRGFNSSYNHRFIQRFDNMDLSMPGFNLSLGMLNGPVDLDIERTELIPGSSSALYGANAITGLLNTISKSPYQHKGLSVNLKTGVNHVDGIDNAPVPLVDFSLRYANTFGDNKWAYKVTLGYLQATDWKATDYSDNANYNYSNNLTSYGYGKGKGNPGYEAANISGDEVSSIFDSATFKVPVPGGGTIPLVNEPLKVARTGYRETDLFAYKPYNIKSDLALFYKPNKNTEISFTSRFSSGSSSFQIDSRAQISNFFLQQHKFEIKGKNFGFRSYVIFENTGNVFDATVTAININRAAKADDNWMASYLFAYSGYYNILNAALGNPNDTLRKGSDEDARKFADGDNSAYAAYLQQMGIDSTLCKLLLGRAQFKPGSATFDSAFHYTTHHPPYQNGSMLYSTSKAWYTEYIYHFNRHIPFADVITGINYRLNAPNTHGSVFADAQQRIYAQEIGAFAQATKAVYNKRLKFQISARYDKMQRFSAKLSPRASVVFLAGKQQQHSLRLSSQIGYRMPALIDQFNYIDFPRALTLGGFYEDAFKLNLVRKSSDGSDFVNLYFQNSVNAYLNSGDSSKLIKPVIKDIAPEELRSVELGWRWFSFEKLETDLSLFVSNYRNIISTQQYIGPINRSDTISPSYVKNPAQTQLYRMPANSDVPVTALGYTLAFNYYHGKHFIWHGNYNYNYMIESEAFKAQDFIGSFNTPKHKYNLGLSAVNILKIWSFTANFKWVDQTNFKEYNKEGTIAAYYNLDLMLSCYLPKYKTHLKLGGTNVTNNRYTQALGSPTVGAVYYFSILFEDIIH